jgi:uncharacterized protein
MTKRTNAAVGAPCWVDLWTSDVEGSRRFYSELFGWQAHEPDPDHGGYFIFTRDGSPIAGAMGDMGEVRANNAWKLYLATDDIGRTVKLATEHGGTIVAPPMPVDDLGTQAVLVDVVGAAVGAWQPGTFSGFGVLREHGAPSFFGLDTFEFSRAVDFYAKVFGWKPQLEADDDGIQYAGFIEPGDGRAIAGIGDARGIRPDGVPSVWSVLWRSDDVDASVAKVQALGGAVVMQPTDSPFGRIAGVTDPAGARFRLHKPNR